MSGTENTTEFYESRVAIYSHEQKIIKFDQVRVLSEESLHVCFTKIDTTSQIFDQFFLIINFL